jgi:hypothetical protein
MHTLRNGQTYDESVLTETACLKQLKTADSNRNDTQTWYHYHLQGHCKMDCIHFKYDWDQRNTVNKGTASTSLATAADRDLICLAGNSTALTAGSTPASWVNDSGSSHPMRNSLTRFTSIQKLRQPIVIELGDDNRVTVSHHGLIKGSQAYEVDALHTSMLRLSLPSINQLDTTRYPSTFGCGKYPIYSASITIAGNLVNDHYILSPSTALSSTQPSISMKFTSSRRKKKRTRASSISHSTVPSIVHSTTPTTCPRHTASPSAASTVQSIAHSTKPTTRSLYTASPSVATTVHQCPSATKYPTPTWRPIAISESGLWQHCLAHYNPTTL